MKQGRKIILLLLLLLSYTVYLIHFFGGSIVFLDHLSPILNQVIWILIFLFFLNLSIPDLRQVWIHRIWWSMSAIFLILFFVYYGNINSETILILLSWVLIHLGIYLTAWYKYRSVSNRVKPVIWIMHYVYTFAFSLFVAWSIALYSVTHYDDVPFDCNDIQSSQESFYSTIFFPLSASYDMFESTKTKITAFLEKDYTEILFGNDWVDTSIEQLEIDQALTSTGGVIGLVDTIRYSILSSTLDNKKLVDNSVCTAMIELIQTQWKNYEVRYSVIFLLFLLLYPFLSIAFITVSVLSYIVFILLQRLGLWTRVQEMKWVEDVE